MARVPSNLKSIRTCWRKRGHKKRSPGFCTVAAAGSTARRALGGVNFVGLGKDQREALVSRAAQAERKTLPREFFEHVRRRAFRNYYGQPTTWLSLGYGGPPQPNGFPDHDKPPPKAEP